MSQLAKIIHYKELIIEFYQKHADVINPVSKGIFSFLTLMILRGMFPYDTPMRNIAVLFVISVAQAFVPISVLFFTGFALILTAAWSVSADIAALFLIVFFIYLLGIVRLDGKSVVILMLTPILFVCKLEFFLPVVLGMLIGYQAILPCVGGILLYFLSQYTADANSVLMTSSNTEIGTALQRVFDLLTIDKHMLVSVLTFALIILLAAGLSQLTYERARIIAIIGGNIALAFIMLMGKLFFAFDMSIIRLFVEAILSMGLAQIVMLFRGTGDLSRIEHTTFEDDEYIYYVKAVPKMKMAQIDVNKKDIN